MWTGGPPVPRVWGLQGKVLHVRVPAAAGPMTRQH